MDFDDAEKIIEKGKKRPIKTLIGLFVILIMIAAYALVTNYCGEKGKQFAEPLKTSSETQETPKENQLKVKNNDQPQNKVIIEQHTEGDQSPNIVSDDETNITYGVSKDKKKKD
jgi:hypothetical protein